MRADLMRRFNRQQPYSEPVVIGPKFWHCRKSESDAKNIWKCMRMIPEEKRQEVADEYDRLFLSKAGTYWEAREKANKYLGDQARYYKELRES